MARDKFVPFSSATRKVEEESRQIVEDTLASAKSTMDKELTRVVDHFNKTIETQMKAAEAETKALKDQLSKLGETTTDVAGLSQVATRAVEALADREATIRRMSSMALSPLRGMLRG